MTSTTPESHPEQEGGGDAQPEKSFVEPDHATADNVINPYGIVEFTYNSYFMMLCV